ncbi:hypothetical protein [Flavobacterium sp.]
MKAKITLLVLALTVLLQSCASHCGNKSWRTARFVYQQPTTEVLQPQA